MGRTYGAQGWSPNDAMNPGAERRLTPLAFENKEVPLPVRLAFTSFPSLTILTEILHCVQDDRSPA
ncbi:hypothetical protein, partial [Dialister sp.]|uniref:hypothetical protein n=1 Tax=Dialister sp. TaxID=1955814 RepID=UPI003F0C2C98